MRKNLLIKEGEMQRRMYEVSVLKELGDRIGYSLNVQKIVDVITGSLRRLLPYSTVSYLLLGEEGRIIFHCVLEESISKRFVEDVKVRMIQALSALIDRQIKLDDVDESISGTITDESNHKDVHSFFNIPVVINNKPMGILNISSTEEGLYKEDEMTLLYTIMNQASTAVSKLETILNLEKGKLNSMVASMADGVFMVDTRNRLLVINPVAKQMLGIKKPQPSIFDVLDAVASKMDLRTKIEASMKLSKLIIEEQLKMGSAVLRILISPVKDNEDQPLGAVILFHDITQEKALEKMREDFTSMMVHELRSPLTGIRSIANLLKEDNIKKSQKKYQDFLDLIVSNSASMLDLVNDLLDVAKLESGKFQVLKKETNLKDLIGMRTRSFSSLASDNHLNLVTKIDTKLPLVSIDENKIGQVLNNLLSNAIKFTPPNTSGAGFTHSGQIIVSAFVLKANQELLEKITSLGMIWAGIKEFKPSQDMLVVAVTDTGLGISEADLPKLFNKFSQLEQTAASEKKGTGLGLVISKGIVEAHNGTVGVFSQLNKGSTFYFMIPMEILNADKPGGALIK